MEEKEQKKINDLFKLTGLPSQITSVTMHRALPILTISLKNEKIYTFNYKRNEIIDVTKTKKLNSGVRFIPIDSCYNDIQKKISEKLGIKTSKPTKVDPYELFFLTGKHVIMYNVKSKKSRKSQNGIFGNFLLTKMKNFAKNLLILGNVKGEIFILNASSDHTYVKQIENTFHKSKISFFEVFFPFEQSLPFVTICDGGNRIGCWNLQNSQNSGNLAFKFMDLESSKESSRYLQGEKIKKIELNNFFKIFLVLTDKSLTLWNCFTGLLTARIEFVFQKKKIQNFCSLALSNKKGYYRAGYYLGDIYGNIYHFSLENLKIKFDKKFELDIKNNTIELEYLAKDPEMQDIQGITVNGIRRIAFLKKRDFSIFDEVKDRGQGESITRHPMYFTRIATNLAKELIQSDGYIKDITNDNLSLILKSEMEDLNTERMNLVPKLLYLNKVGYYLRCNLIEFFTEGPKKVNYSTLSSIMYTDEISQEGARIATSKSGKFISLLYPSLKMLRILKISNSKLKQNPDAMESDIEYLHPLGDLEKVFEVKSDQICWHSDLAQFACQSFIGVNLNGGDPKPSLSIYAVNERDSRVVLIHRVNFDQTFCLLGSSIFFTFFEKQSMCITHQCSREGPIISEQFLLSCPEAVKFTSSNGYCLFAYKKSILVKKFNVENQKFVEHGSSRLSNFDSDVVGIEIWQDLVIVFTEYSIYISILKVFGQEEASKIKIASRMLDSPSVQKIEVQGPLHYLSLMDMSLVLVNREEEVEVIDLSWIKPLQFYFNLMQKKAKECLEMANRGGDTQQDLFIRMFLANSNFKLPCMVSSFPSFILNELGSILSSTSIPLDIKFEYTRMALSIVSTCTKNDIFRILKQIRTFSANLDPENQSKIDSVLRQTKMSADYSSLEETY